MILKHVTSNPYPVIRGLPRRSTGHGSRVTALVLVLVLVLGAHAQTPDISTLRNGSVTFGNVDTGMEYHVEWATGLGGTNQFQPHYRDMEYITPTSTAAMTVSAPQFFRIVATNKLSNNIYRISDLPTVVTSGSAKVDVEWSESPNGPWYTNWTTPQEQSDPSPVITLQAPRYFRVSFVNCTSGFASCSDWTDLTDPGADRTVNFGGGFGFAYSPKCSKIKVGQTVTFSGDSFGTHPLRTSCQEHPSITNTSSGSSAAFQFIKPGYYGFYCNNHGNIGGGGMAGSLWVIP